MDALTIFLLNVLFAILAGAFTLWFCGEMGLRRRIAVIIAVIVGVIVYLLHLASYFPKG